MQRELEFRNYSPQTVRCYLSALSRLSEHFKTRPDHIESEQVKDYLQYLSEEKKISPSTINQIIGAFKILQVDILGKAWEGFRIKRARINKRLPIVFSREEVSQLISATKNLKHKSILLMTYGELFISGYISG